MNNNFREAQLDQDFCLEVTTQARQLITSATSFTVVGMPSLGISIFLRFLCGQNFANFFYIDIYELPELTTRALFAKLAQTLNPSGPSDFQSCKKRLLELSQGPRPTVIVFSRFDQLKSTFSQTFFNNLRALRDIDKSKIVFIFSANKPLLEICPESFDIANLNMYSTTLYLKPYSVSDLKELLKQNSPTTKASGNELRLSGGHYQLLQLLLKSDYAPDYLKDPVIKLQIQSLLGSIGNFHKQQLLRLSLGKNQIIDSYLYKLGVINTNNEIFSPLISEYLLQKSPLHFTPQQSKLFTVLKQNINQIISKESLYNIVWEDSSEASNWALDTLIHRLRQNPQFKTKFQLENYKRIGYKLTRL